MKLANLAAYARRPVSLVVKLRMDVHNAMHPGEPWLVPGAVRFCEEHLTREMRGLEWGSGRSTVWFGSRIGSLVSVEHDEGWAAKTRAAVEAAGLRGVEVRLLNATKQWENSPYVSVVEDFADESLDFVVVDGLFRQECVARVLPKVAPGGYVLVDDTAHLADLAHWGFPPSWKIVSRNRFLVAETTIWQKPR